MKPSEVHAGNIQASAVTPRVLKTLSIEKSACIYNYTIACSIWTHKDWVMFKTALSSNISFVMNTFTTIFLQHFLLIFFENF